MDSVTASYRARRVWHSERLVRELEACEPRTSIMINDLSSGRPWPWRRRAWVIAGPGGEFAGSVVATRVCFDRWTIQSHLRDTAAAAVVAAVVDRSPGLILAGASDDVWDVARHVARRGDVDGVPWLVSAHPHAFVGEPDGRTRVATPEDLDALVALYAQFELGLAPTTWQLRAWLRGMLRHHIVIVIEHESQIVGAVSISSRTRRFVSIDSLVVAPSCRASGLSWSLLARAQAIVNAMGLDGTAAVAPSNPMDFGDAYDPQLWLSVSLRQRHDGRLMRLGRRLYDLVGRIDFEQPASFRGSRQPLD